MHTMKKSETPSDKYRPVHPAVRDIGFNFPDLCYKTFKDKPYAFVYDNRTVENSIKPIAKIIKHGNHSSVYINNEITYRGNTKSCLTHIYYLLTIGAIKNGSVC